MSLERLEWKIKTATTSPQPSPPPSAPHERLVRVHVSAISPSPSPFHPLAPHSPPTCRPPSLFSACTHQISLSFTPNPKHTADQGNHIAWKFLICLHDIVNNCPNFIHKIIFIAISNISSNVCSIPHLESSWSFLKSLTGCSTLLTILTSLTVSSQSFCLRSESHLFFPELRACLANHPLFPTSSAFYPNPPSNDSNCLNLCPTAM